MAKKQARQPESDEAIRTPSIEKSVARIAALVGLHLVRDMNQGTQAVFFTKAGYSALEVAQMLATTPNTVYAALSASRKRAEGSTKKSDKGK